MQSPISFLIAALILSVIFLTFGILANIARGSHQYAFELKPNCLLTRHPVVFLTGTRSLFYFRKYWNAFPVLLAEHGYEVFTLHLPWSGPLRLKKLTEFLNDPQNQTRKFHFVMDRATRAELSGLSEKFPSILSETVPQVLEIDSSPAVTVQVCLWLHQRIFARTAHPLLQAAELGADFPRGSSWLLQRMQELGEQDFLR